MPIAGKLVLYGPDGKLLDGSLPVADSEITNLTGSSIEEFNHLVWTQLDKIDFFNDWCSVRKHKPIRIVKTFDCLTIPLYRYCTRGIFLPKVELRWYRHEDGKKELFEWARITLEHVRVFSIKQILYNVKDMSKERCGHTEEVKFVYQRITWLRMPGYVLYTDEWNKFFNEFDQKDHNSNNTGEDGDAAPLAGPSVLSISASGWDHQDDNRRKESPNEVREGDVILLQAEVDGKPLNGETVRFELYYQEPKQNSLTFETVNGTVKDSVATAEWTVDLSNINKRKNKANQVKEYKLHFEASVKGKYGNKCPIVICKLGVPVSFYEYPYAHESKLDSKGIPAKLFKNICEYHDTALLTPTRTGPVLVKEKWVYVFAKKGSGVSLFYECKPTVQGDKQAFEFVSWTEADQEKNQKSYPRQTTGKSKDTFTLQPDREYYVLISQIQLPLARIDFYTQHADTLAKRALHIPANTLKADAATVNLYLTDYIEIAFYLREQYDKHVQSFEKFVSDKEKAQRMYLAGLVCAVAESKPRLKGWLDYNAVVKERDQNDQETRERLDGKTAAEVHLRDWKLSSGFKSTREDYAGTKEIEESILEHETALTTFDEIKYLEAEGEDKKSWLNEIFEPEGRFIFFRKLETLTSNKDFWDLFGKYIVAKYLANFGPTKMKGVLTVEVQTQRLERFLDEIHVVIERAKIKLPDLVQNKGRWFFVTIDHETKMPFIDYEFKGSGQASGISHLDTKNYRPVKRKWNAIQKHIDTALPSLQKVLVAIEAANLANSVHMLLNSKNMKDLGFNLVNWAGSTADFLASFEHLGKKQVIKVFQQQGNILKDAKLLTERSFAIVNLAGAICDYIGALKGTAEESSQGHNGLAAGWATIGLASGASGTAATMVIGAKAAELAGVEVGAEFISAFGLSSTALGVIGIGLFVVGGGILWLFEDSDLHEWAKKCSWTKELEKPESVEHQIKTLHELICEFTADSYLYENRMPGTEVFAATGSVLHKLEYLFTVRVRPGYYAEEKSRYIVNVKIVHEGGFFGKDKTVLEKALLFSGKDAQKVSTLKGDETYTVLLHRFTGAELGLLGDYQNGTFKYSLSAHLDFYGDGSQMLFDVKKEGKLEIRGRDV